LPTRPGARKLLASEDFHGGDSVDARPQRQAVFPKSNVDTPAGFWFYLCPFGVNFMYAVLETGSKQYRVSAGDTLHIERLAVEAGKPFIFDRVLLVNADGKVTVGAPTVTGATVVADVVEHIRGEKKLTFKMKRRKGYHKSIGHRQELTVVKVTEIKA
jgi:large subunit ribosomal protein L21